MPDIDLLADKLRERIGKKASRTAEFYTLSFPQEKPPEISPKQRAQDFIQMPIEEKQRLYLEMGPDQWPKFVSEEMSNAVAVYGDNASAALPFYYMGLPEQVAPETTQQDAAKASLEELLGIELPELAQE